MSRVRFTPRAEANLEDIVLYIARDNPERAKTFVAEIVDHCDRIAAQPGIGRARPEFGPEYRSMPHGNYVIFYQIVEDGVEIMHVLHGARDIKAPL